MENNNNKNIRKNPMQENKEKELWERMKLYALTDEDFMRKMEERRIEGISWKIIKYAFGIILAGIALYAPAKVAEWISSHMSFSGK